MTFLLKDLWIHHIFPLLSPIDLCRFQLVSKRSLQLTQSFQYILNRWKSNILTHFTWCLSNASYKGHYDLVKLSISYGADDWNTGLQAASQGGHKDLVLFFINKGANNWNWGLQAASEGGHKDLVHFFINKGANDWNPALYCASLGGHKELIQFFQNKIK